MNSRPAVRFNGAHTSLCELQSVHENVLAWMAALDELTAQESCRPGQLETVRWFLSKARRDRRLLLEQIYNQLLKSLTPEEAETVRALRNQTHRTLEAGSQHVAKWTLGAVKNDWDAYREETRAMRALWTATIEAEQDLLYPLLQP